MTPTAQIHNATCVVTLAGEFDRANVDDLREEIDWCLDQAPSVLFDFGAVTFVDGAVLGVLLVSIEQLREGGWLGVARPSAVIERLFTVAGLTGSSRFRVYSTLEQAMDEIERGVS